MDSSILIQVLIVVAIVVGLMMIVILWRVIGIMNDLRAASALVLKRIREIDQTIDETKERISSFAEIIKNFIFSFEFMKTIKEKIEKGSVSESEKENHEQGQ